MATLASRVGSGLTETSIAPIHGPGSITINESNQPVVVLAPDDDASLKDSMRIAFAILQYIQGLKLSCLKGGRMACIRADLFVQGPAWRHAAWESATKTGFILEMSNGSPALITTLGQWHTGIASHSSELEVKEMMNSIQGPLGLKLIQDVEEIKGWGEHGPYYSINQWEGKSLPRPYYRNKDQLIPLKKIRSHLERAYSRVFP